MAGGLRPAGRGRRAFFGAVCALLFFLAAVGIWHTHKPLPPGLSFDGPPRPAEGVEFLRDFTWSGPGGTVSDQQIFDRAFDLIRGARRLIILDMFLFNDFAGELKDGMRPLSRELTDLLVARKTEVPSLRVILITDPFNTVYGSLMPANLVRLRDAGVEIAVTDLDRLRDSNPLFSAPWRVFVRPFGSGPGRAIPNPFGPGRVSLRSMLRLANFKANHRKTVIADRNGVLVGLVTSANPHDGSSAHSNIALVFQGAAAADLLETERAVLAFSGGPDPGQWPGSSSEENRMPDGAATLRVVTEARIRSAVVSALATAGEGDSVDLMMFYLSDRAVIEALASACGRGAAVRVLLDPNKDAFGRTKDGIPNRPVGSELARRGAAVRWFATNGEQAHSKMLVVRRADESQTTILGSANMTRRNIGDLNLETDVVFDSRRDHPAAAAASETFDTVWNNDNGRGMSLDFEVFSEDSRMRYLRYRTLELTGLCTF
ncbi:MAG: phospholipase [Lentisphaerae bacterium]|nr:phospholipase [Lentisphaerota bacterium]